jgi:hypothetical protein
VRPLALNLLTSLATIVVLASLAVPAVHVLRSRASPGKPAAAATAAPPARTFGVYVDPWHVDEWSRAVGARPQMVSTFEPFARHAAIEPFLVETERRGIGQVMISWEPWDRAPASFGATRPYGAQPGYRNGDIAGGAQDAYIRRFARSLATFHGTVWLRYAPEMNGSGTPWSQEPRDYVRAWRHVVTLVRAEGARNVRFVWSADPSVYGAAWSPTLRQYWPGARWVDVVGSTMIDVGARTYDDVGRFTPRLGPLRRMFHKPLFLTETTTQHAAA